MKNYINNKVWKILIILVCVIIVGAFWYSSYLEEKKSCMGVQILSETDMRKYTEYEYQDFSQLLRHKDELVSMDVEDSTIYIAQNINDHTIYNDLQGIVTIDDTKYQLYFGADDAFKNLDEAVKEGHEFSLYVTDGSATYMKYNVVFTTLPVIRLDGEVTHQNEEGRDVFTGDICVWAPIDPDSKSYTVKTSDLEWHLRGGTTKRLKKNSWKISLKKENGENRNLAFCGLGADDDWVLNAMALDDTKMREHLFMDLWNEVASQNTYSYKMSSGEYVEVVSNGKYLGLYMIQRRIDTKYLGLGKNTSLVRGKRLTTAPTSVYEAYEIRGGDLSEEEVYAVMYAPYWGLNFESLVNVDNFVDMNMFVGLAMAPDNSAFNNTYWIVEKESGENQYSISMVPWDTDISFGIVASGGFRYDYGATVYTDMGRRETAFLISNTEYVEKVFSRWKELRDTTFDTEHILSYLEEYDEQLIGSGAFHRNTELWGLRNGGKDYEESYNNLTKFIIDRLEWMDTIYGY